MGHQVPVPISSNSRNGKATLKRQTVPKMTYIVLEGTDRVTFIREFFKAHTLHEDYSPGVHNGPPFKLWWTGRYCLLHCWVLFFSDCLNSAGGKTGAISIENDAEFVMARTAILQKNKTTCSVGVEFDLENMDGYRVRAKKVRACQILITHSLTFL